MGIIHSTPYMDLPLKEIDGMAASLPPGAQVRRILLVDDDRNVLDATRQLLEHLGYQVTTVSNSPEALDLFRKDPSSFDLVITDLTMPGMTGDELAQQMQDIRNGVPVILYSGHYGTITPGQAWEMGIREIVMKPVRMKDLSRIIKKVLETC